MIYIIGSLRNKKIPYIGKQLTQLDIGEIFTDWFSPGPKADDFWRKFEKIRGSTYKQALSNWSARHVYEFDKFHIDRADTVIMVMPAGRSGHLELGYCCRQKKNTFILFDKEPKRWDVMYQFIGVDNICFSFDELKQKLLKLYNKEENTSLGYKPLLLSPRRNSILRIKK